MNKYLKNYIFKFIKQIFLVPLAYGAGERLRSVQTPVHVLHTHVLGERLHRHTADGADDID